MLKIFLVSVFKLQCINNHAGRLSAISTNVHHMRMHACSGVISRNILRPVKLRVAESYAKKKIFQEK